MVARPEELWELSPRSLGIIGDCKSRFLVPLSAKRGVTITKL